MEKADHFGDPVAKARIMNSEDASDSKEIAREITLFDKLNWSEVASDLCFNGIQEKFQQNDHLIEKLLETEDKTLIKASFDDIWGTGQSLGSKDCLNSRSWKS